MMDRLYQEAESIVLAMWDEEPEEMAAEISVQLSISADYAWDLVQQVIVTKFVLKKVTMTETVIYLIGTGTH